MAKSLHIELAGRGLGYVRLEGKPLVLGRGVDCDVQIPDQRLSRRHCQVELREGQLVVSDLNSSNGTFVRGHRLTQPVRLEPGGSLYMGKTRIVFDDAPESGRQPIPDMSNQTVGMPPPRMQRRQAPQAPVGPPAPPVSAPKGQHAPVRTAPLPSAGPVSPLMPSPAPPTPAPAAESPFDAVSRRGLKETISDPSPVEGYQVFDELGRGAMGVVYSARSIDLERVCVLKTIKFSGSAKDAIFFIRECQAGMKIRHPNVVELFDFGEAGGRLYMAMEYVRGGNLLEYVHANGPISQAMACECLMRLAEALEFAFKKRFVHRDIKPANVLLTKEGQPKLADFGLAKTIQKAHQSGFTQAGETRGTPIYMAPELLMSAADADQRCDVYSLGATFYHALTGHYPFRAKTVPEILRMVVKKNPVPIEQHRSDLAPELVEVIKKMMQKNPAARQQTPSDLKKELELVERALR